MNSDDEVVEPDGEHADEPDAGDAADGAASVDVEAGDAADPAGDAADGVARDDVPLTVAVVRASGLLLVGLAAWRFAADHLVTRAGDVSSFTVERRLADPWWRFAEWSFLTLAVVHGAIGLHWALRRRIRGATARLVVEAVLGAFVGVLFLSASSVLFAG